MDRSALADYLSHQPDSNLRNLQQRRRGRDAVSEKQLSRGGWEKRSHGTRNALEEYLQHQSRQRQQAIGLIKDGELRHRSRVQKLAVDILGTAKRVMARHSAGEGGEGDKSKKDVMKVLGTLQSEISLDTEAISAFR